MNKTLLCSILLAAACQTATAQIATSTNSLAWVGRSLELVTFPVSNHAGAYNVVGMDSTGAVATQIESNGVTSTAFFELHRPRPGA